jgi:hypothetical protein
VPKHANSRFTFQGWKSQSANTENPGYPKNRAQPKNQKQTKLRETDSSAEKTWAKLDVKRNSESSRSSL